MNLLLLTFALAISALGQSLLVQSPAGAPATSQNHPQSAPLTGASIPVDEAGARKAKGLLDQAIQALGGKAYLDIRNIQQTGRTYSFYHGRPTGNGVLFWRFVEYPDKERIEVTKERDVAYLYAGDKGYEITYRGPRPMETKDLEDYLRRRRFSLETVLRTWINDRGVAVFYEGTALAGNAPADRVTLINAKNEAVTLYFDSATHLPVRKSITWRDPIDKQRNIEEETWDNYRLVQGVLTPYGFTRYYNGDMQTQRFVFSASHNQPLNSAMFDPNSGYNPNKTSGKH
ncbi:MAG: hypothetical protein WB562_14895 [Candidatus Sulfotelmatobacter sp.]